MALKTPIFPNILNQRSMIYCDNLSEHIRKIIEKYESGFFFPQNEEYVCTTELVRLISENHGKKIILTKLFNPIISIFQISLIKKVFGNLVYDKSMSDFTQIKYNVVNFKSSINSTED